MNSDPRHDRLDELLATEATQGLTATEASELQTLLADFPDVDPDSFAYAAAAADRVMSGPGESLPPGLAAKLQRAATAYLPATPAPAAPRPARAERPAWLTWTGWVVAAGLAALLIYNWMKPGPQLPPGPGLAPELTAEQKYEIVDRQPGTQRYVGKDKASPASAEVVWNPEKQEGAVKLTGLTPIAPQQGTYQLWIVDRAQQDPIDGGIFKVNPDGTATITVKAALKVADAQAFAVSKESNPNGVPKAQGPIFLVMTPKT